MKYYTAEERMVVNRLLEVLAAKDCEFQVYDGQEVVTGYTRDLEDIKRNLSDCEMDYLYVKHEGKELGYVWLISGNGLDIISDVGYNADDDRLDQWVNEVLDWLDGREYAA